MEKMYNWNGEYKLLKPLECSRFKVSDLKYPEYFYIFENEDETIRYSIIDEEFGYPALANNHEGEHGKKLRKESVQVLNMLESEGYIKKL